MGNFSGILDLSSLQITPEILSLISELDEFKGSWQYFGKLPADRLLALKKVTTIESIGSSTRIEGVQLSDREIEKLLNGIETKTFQTRDEQEVAGYAFACQQIFDHYKELSLTENGIKQLHTWLLHYTEKDQRHKGEYKKIPIRIEAFDGEGKNLGTIFETTSPFETPYKMEELLIGFHEMEKKKTLHPLLLIAIFVVIFLAIHPFQDGNGRLSRLLTTLLMLRFGYLYVPYSSFESFIEANKESYYLALQRTQKTWQSYQTDWNPWIVFFLRSLQNQKKHLEVKLKKEKILLEQLPELNQCILDLLSNHGRLSIKEIAALIQSNRNTLKKALAQLVKENYISLQGKGKGSWYTLN